ncbi:MAG: hypothetical protein P4L41_10695 [Flavipsychrobacter sp.]|nr:hypothetical protein [Flavipsychrobacter sp.]
MKVGLFIIYLLFCSVSYGQDYTTHVYTHADSMRPPSILRNINIIKPITPDYYTTGFGFFCKQELKLEKVKVPLKLRVGNPDYCSYLESKSNSIPLQK